MNLFISAFLIIFAAVSIKRPALAVMLIIAGLPLYLIRFDIFGLPMTLLEAMILIAFFCWFVFQTRFKDFVRGRYGLKDFIKNSPFHRGGSVEGRRFYPFGVEIILLLIISFIAVGVSGFSDGALGIWKAYFFEPALLYILILNIPLLGRGGSAAETEWVKKIGLSLAIGAFAVAVYAVFQKFTGFGIANPLWAAESTRRVVSFFGYPNAVGLYLAPIIPVLAAFLFLPGKKLSAKEKKLCFPLKKENISALGLSRGFLGFIILLSLAAVFFAQSEGALLGLIAAAFVFCLLAGKKSRLAAVVILLIVSAGIYFYPPANNYAEKKLTLMDFSGQLRRYQWKETLKMLGEGRFYSGAGLDNYQKTIKPYHQEGFFYDDGTDPNFHQHTVESAEYRAKTWQPVEIYKYPHNIILNFWSELGLAGLILFIWMIIKFLIINFQLSIKDKKNRYIYLGLLCSMLVIAVHGLVDVPYFKNDLSCLFWILIALAVLQQKNLPTKGREE